MGRTMQEPTTGRIYNTFSKFYDQTFGRLVHHRQQLAIDHLHLSPGQCVLDLGVGTGISLTQYPAGVHVVGIDLSEGMLRRAAGRQSALKLRADLVLGDALRTPFADGAFDHVLITHVISVVSDPTRLLHEAARVVGPGGRVVMVNHFQSTNRVVASVESLLNPLFTRIGWRSDLSLAEAVAGVPLRLEYMFHCHPGDVWKIVVLRRT